MSAWNIEEPLADDEVGEPPSPLASLVYISKSLRRRWRTWVIAGVIGMVLATGYTLRFPPKSVATVALSLQHASGADPASAMQTDVAILKTREVAGRTIAALGEHVTPDHFMSTYSGEATTSSVLTIAVDAADPQTAVRTARTLADTYLAYRGSQMESSTAAQVAGVQNQIASLQQQLTTAQAQYEEFKNDPTQATTANVDLQQENSLRGQIGSLQTTVRTAQNATEALINGSTVLDPAAAVPSSPVKHAVLTLFTGLTGGLAVGVGIVVVSALLSTRLRRRSDVARAAGAPVTYSVARLRAGGGGGILPLRRRRTGSAASYGVQVLAQGLESAVDARGSSRIALVTLDSEDDGLTVAAFTGAHLTSERRQVFLVDLTVSGRLEKKVRRAVGAAVRPSVAPTVYRPEVAPPFACGPLAARPGRPSDLGPNDPTRVRWDGADVVVAVAPADLDTGLDHLAGWADSAILLVTAGRSTAEAISTAAGLLRSAGLQVLSVLMVGTDGTDQSLGRIDDDTDATGEAVTEKIGRVRS